MVATLPKRLENRPPADKIIRTINDLLGYIGTGGTSISLPDGTNAAPSLAFTADPDTGLYRVGANDAGLTAGGVLVVEWKNTGGAPQLLLASGTASLPGLAFSSDVDNGLRYIGTDKWALVVGGSDALVVTKDANGIEVGIGSGTPTVPLHVSKSQGDYISKLINLNQLAGGRGLLAQVYGNNAADPIIAAENNGATTPVRVFGAWADGMITGKGDVPLQTLPLLAACNANTTLTTSMADVPGASIVLNRVGNWLVFGTFRWAEASAGDVGLVATGQLVGSAGSSIVNSTSQAMTYLTTLNQAWTSHQVWLVQVASGAPTLKLQTQKNGGVSGVGSVIAQTDTVIAGGFFGNPVP